MKNIGIILGGGIGNRFESDIPKQFHLIDGKEILWYSVEAFRQSEKCDAFLIVCVKDLCDRVASQYSIDCIAGGSSRNESLYNGLCYIANKFPNCKNVFIHESARPMLTPKIIDNYFQSLDTYHSVITASHISDSLGQYGHKVTMRDDYYLIQAPEAFRFKELFENFNPQSPITATVQQMPQECSILKCFELKHNIKITYPHDLMLVEYLISSTLRKGYDR